MVLLSITKFFRKTKSNQDPLDVDTTGMITVRECFESRFIIIYDREILPDHNDMINWTDKNTTYSVQVKVLPSIGVGKDWLIREHTTESPALDKILKVRAFIGFENDADALMFKIKYM